MPQHRRPHSYPWEEQAQWLRDHLSEMTITLNERYNTIATVWMSNDDGEGIMRMGTLLQECFGAYICGPASNVKLPGKDVHESFGFWNQALLDHAARVLPLPEGLKTGRLVFPYDTLDEQAWDNLDRYYDKKPGELPPPSCYLPHEE